MASIIIRRIISLVPVMAIVGILVFLAGHFAPGDPAIVLAGQYGTPEQIELIRHQMGLDRPLAEQLVLWIRNALRGDLGMSLFMKQPVGLSIRQRIEPTGLLTLLSLIFAIVIGVPIGIFAAQNRNTLLDRVSTLVSLAGVCIPSFWLGMMLMLLFAVRLHVLPPSGYVPFRENPVGCLRYMILPAFSLGLAHAAFLSRITRSTVLEVLHEDYVRTARAKGLRENMVLQRHVLPNALIPIITVIGNSAGILLGGAVITESVFNLPGVGRLIIQSVTRRDYPVIQGSVLAIAAVYVIVNLIVDIVYVLIDPRIREER